MPRTRVCLTLDHLQLLGVQAVRGQERKVPVGGTVTVSVDPFVFESIVFFFLDPLFLDGGMRRRGNRDGVYVTREAGFVGFTVNTQVSTLKWPVIQTMRPYAA